MDPMALETHPALTPTLPRKLSPQGAWLPRHFPLTVSVRAPHLLHPMFSSRDASCRWSRAQARAPGQGH